MLCSKLEKIIQHFLQYFKSIDSRQVKAKEMASEVRGIGVAISTQDVSDFLDESKIRESYLGGYCVFRGFQPDSIKKKLKVSMSFTYFYLEEKRNSNKLQIDGFGNAIWKIIRCLLIINRFKAITRLVFILNQSNSFESYGTMLGT